MAEQPLRFGLVLEHIGGYEFRVKFDAADLAPLVVDEPAPLGKQKGPNASRLLAAAVGNCLSASLLFCLRKAHLEPAGLKTAVHGELARAASGRLRVARLEVTIALEGELARERLRRCAQIFQDYCVVTESVRAGIPVSVRVTDAGGTTLFEDSPTGTPTPVSEKP